jgi:nitrogen fixation protein NifB
LQPAGRLSHLQAPLSEEIHSVRRSLEGIIPQFYRCTQCRADACGIPQGDEMLCECVK